MADNGGMPYRSVETRRLRSGVLVAAAVLALGTILDAWSGPKGLQSRGPDATGARIASADGRVSMTAPPGFTRLSSEEVQKYLPTAGPGSQVFGDSARTVTLVFQIVDIKLTRAQLDQFRKYLTQQLENGMGRLEWLISRVENVGGRDGIRLEFTDQRQLQHISLVGHIDDEHSLMFGYNVAVKDAARLDPAIRASIASIAIKP